MIVLYYDRDMKLGEIAETLHLPVNTVSTRLRRARALLKTSLGEEVDA
ncbi:MAG: sigma factor-like helix-turn-helix DNA-binding protein [Candidatus Ventricola sp.]